jgi:hypothetical protein
MGMKRNKLATYCAFCKLPRQVYRKRGVSLVNILQSLGMSAGLSFIFWRELDPRAMIFFVALLGFMEVGILLRGRAELQCPHCGFDPVMYKRSPEKTSEHVKKTIEARKEDPEVWLARKPPIRVGKRRKNSSREIIA